MSTSEKKIFEYYATNPVINTVKSFFKAMQGQAFQRKVCRNIFSKKYYTTYTINCFCKILEVQ